MLIHKIEIFNFGPFYGKHELFFEKNGEGVHLIRGNNGQGKTSIQSAILWAFYGEIKNRKGSKIPITSLINRNTVKNYDLVMGVKIYFNHEDNDWILTRETHARAHRIRDYDKNMSLYLAKGVTTEQNEKAQLTINRIIPVDVSKFFFFDGEMLRDYEELLDQNSSAMKQIKKDIEYVLGIPYLSLAKEDVKNIKDKFEKDKIRLLRNFGGETYKEVAQKLDEAREEIKRLENLIVELQKQYDGLEIEISDKNRELVDYEETKKLAIEKIKILKDIEILENKEDEINKDNNLLVSMLYKNILKEKTEDIIKKLKLKHDEKMGKYNEKQKLIQRLSDVERGLKDSVCRLCGHVLDEEKLKYFEREKIEINKKIDSLTEIPEPNLEYENSVKILEKVLETPDKKNLFKEYEEKLNGIFHELAAKKSRLSKIEELLEGVNEEEPFRIQREIREMQSELTRLEIDIEKEKENLNKKLTEKSEIEKKYKSINEREYKILEKRIDISNKLIILFEAATLKFRESKREEVEKISTEIFLKIRSKNEFKSLEINENYGLSIITESGIKLDKSEWRSAGEEQIVALSLIGALNKCAQINAPIFMDTPFSRLDTIHGERALKFIPTLANQVVLLVTDREFKVDDEQYLQGKISSDYTVIHRGEERGSNIIQTRNIGGV